MDAPPPNDAPRAPLSLKQEQLAVAGCVLWVLVWGLRAIYLDHRITASDNIFPAVDLMVEIVSSRALDWERLLGWFGHSPVHPPLPALHASLVAAALGHSSDNAQVASLLLHGVLVVQVYRLAREGAGHQVTALLATALAATAPPIAAWYRVDYPEALVTVLLLAVLHQAANTDLQRARPALLLGLLVGLGALSKLSFLVVALVPAVYFIAASVRSKRALVNALLAVGVTALVSGWWYFSHLGQILDNLHNSTSTQATAWERAEFYLMRPPGNLLLTAAALLGLGLALYKRLLAPRTLPWLLLLAYLPAWLAFTLVFDQWERYILPLLPLSCLFAAVGVGWLLGRLQGWPARLALGVAALALAGVAAAYNTAPPGDPNGLCQDAGILSPDRRDFSSLARALPRLASWRVPAVKVASSADALDWMNGQMDRLAAADRVPWLNTDEAKALIKEGRPVHFVHVAGRQAEPNRAFSFDHNVQARRMLTQHKPQQLARFTDESHYVVTLLRIK